MSSVEGLVSYIYALICGVDKQTWYFAAGVLVAITIIRIIVKGIKKAIVIICIALLITYGASVVQGVSSKLGISYNNNYITVNNEYINDVNIEVSSISEIKMTRQNNKATISINTHNGESVNYDIDVKYYNPAKVLLERLPVSVVVN